MRLRMRAQRQIKNRIHLLKVHVNEERDFHENAYSDSLIDGRDMRSAWKATHCLNNFATSPLGRWEPRLLLSHAPTIFTRAGTGIPGVMRLLTVFCKAAPLDAP